MTPDELKSCPFCGRTATLSGYDGAWFVSCSDSDCRGSEHSQAWVDATDAMAAWNRREAATALSEATRERDEALSGAAAARQNFHTMQSAANELNTKLSEAKAENERLTRERDEAREELWNLGLAVGVIAKWTKPYFYRGFPEAWTTRTADIFVRWGNPARAIEILRVTSQGSKPNKVLDAKADEIAALKPKGGDNGEA